MPFSDLQVPHIGWWRKTNSAVNHPDKPSVRSSKIENIMTSAHVFGIILKYYQVFHPLSWLLVGHEKTSHTLTKMNRTFAFIVGKFLVMLKIKLPITFLLSAKEYAEFPSVRTCWNTLPFGYSTILFTYFDLTLYSSTRLTVGKAKKKRWCAEKPNNFSISRLVQMNYKTKLSATISIADELLYYKFST